MSGFGKVQLREFLKLFGDAKKKLSLASFHLFTSTSKPVRVLEKQKEEIHVFWANVTPIK